jgi:hypothetical protein
MIRRPVPFLLFVAGILAAYLSLSAWSSIAHADPVGEVVTAPAVVQVTSWVMFAVGALTGALTGIVAALAAVGAALHFIAPRTKTTADDRAAVWVDRMESIGAEVLAALRAFMPGGTVVQELAPIAPASPVIVNVHHNTGPAEPATVTTTTTTTTPEVTHTSPTSPGSLTTIAGVLLLLAMVGVTLAPACDSWRPRTAAGAKAFLDCESPHVDATMLADAKVLAGAAVSKWISGSGTIDATGLKADTQPLKTDLLKCAFDAAMAALLTPAPAVSGPAAMAAGITIDRPQVRTTWADVRRELAWAPSKAAQ